MVQRIGRDETAVAEIFATTFAADRASWQSGQPGDWALESFAAAKAVAYALPSTTVPDEHGTSAYTRDELYEQRAVATARVQLAKAGFRLAALLNAALR